MTYVRTIQDLVKVLGIIKNQMIDSIDTNLRCAENHDKEYLNSEGMPNRYIGYSQISCKKLKVADRLEKQIIYQLKHEDQFEVHRYILSRNSNDLELLGIKFNDDLTTKLEVVEKTTDRFEYGYVSTRATPYHEFIEKIPYMRSVVQHWFCKTPHKMVTESLGVETTEARAREFANLYDDLFGYYYVAMATPASKTDEAFKWMLGYLSETLRVKKIDTRRINMVLPAPLLKEFLELLEAGKIEKKFAKEIVDRLIDSDDKSVDFLETIIKDEKYKVMDDSSIQLMIDQIMAENPEMVEKAKANSRLAAWFVGQVMKKSKGKASPQSVSAIISEKLSK